MNRIKTQGIDHIGLTVLDIEQTKTFFMTYLSFEQVGERPDYPAVFLSDETVMITLWQVIDPASARMFDRHHQAGLHHCALRVGSLRELEQVFRIMEQADGVEIESAPVALSNGDGAHMMCIEPGGLRIEFIARTS